MAKTGPELENNRQNGNEVTGASGLVQVRSDLQAYGRKRLKQAGIETAGLDARVLLCHVCKIDEAELIAYPEKRVEKRIAGSFVELVEQRCRRLPLAHLLGAREFWGREFFVSADTLIPRPETECAVELAIDQAREVSARKGSSHILDLGTGTGCMLISILSEVEAATGVGVDIDSRAVELARKNAQALGVGPRARFSCMNWGAELEDCFDIIVSNPPYIRSQDIPGLMPEVALHEPLTALDGGVDGLDEFRKIIPQAAGLLTPRGILVLEIGDGQASKVLELLWTTGFERLDPDEPVKYDLAGRERVVAAVKVC